MTVVQEGSCDKTPFEEMVFPYLDSGLALCHENPPKIVCMTLKRIFPTDFG